MCPWRYLRFAWDVACTVAHHIYDPHEFDRFQREQRQRFIDLAEGE